MKFPGKYGEGVTALVKSLNILMIGSTTNVKGGMTTVVQSFLRHSFGPGINLSFIPTHSDKGAIYNAGFFGISLIRIFFHFLFKRPQIIHMHMSERGSFIRKYLIFKLAKAFGVKVLVHTHGAEFKQYYETSKPGVKKRISELLKNADKIITLGRSWEMIIKDIEPQADTTVLMNSIPIPDFQRPANAQTEFNVLFLAVLIERKGILDLIHASVPVIEQAEKAGRKIIFHIAGDGKLKEAAMELVALLGIVNSYEFHGWVDEAQKKNLLKLSDLFVLPSYNEGLPMSILEALSYEMPVISTNVGSIEEAVYEGVNGYLIAPGDIEVLSEKMTRLIFSDDNKMMGKQSRELAENKFDNKKYFLKMEKIYRSEMTETEIQEERGW